MGVVFVLQNPGVGGIRRTGQEAEYQEILLSLTSNHDVDKYTQYVAGTLPMVPGWYMWQRFVGEVVEGCLTVQEIAWLNAVKFRTPDNAGLRANKKRHSLKDHLSHELKLLQPAFVVTISEPAREAVVQSLSFLPENTKHGHLAMRGSGSSRQDAHRIRDGIKRLNLCGRMTEE